MVLLIHKKLNFLVTQTIEDPEGRFILVNGEIRGQRVALLNLYGPNVYDAQFCARIHKSLSDIGNTSLLGGGGL